MLEAKWLEVAGLKGGFDRVEAELKNFHYRHGDPRVGPLIVPAGEFLDAAAREQELLWEHHNLIVERDALGRQLQTAMKELSELRK